MYARYESLNAALLSFAEDSHSERVAHVKNSFEIQQRRAEKELAGTQEDFDQSAVARLATESQRARLNKLREENKIGDAAFQQIQQEIDWMELGWAQVMRNQEK